MAAFVILLVSVLLITELNFINTVPVPELSVKLLCELLCEHCNGVSNMESGHCNCEVPEAHFKDNSACLERVQISAAEMNLKLTHFKNTRRERSVNDILGRSKSVDPDINYHSRGYNKISDEPLLTPPTPNPLYVDQSEYQIPELVEVFVKRSINVFSDPEEELQQSQESELFSKRYINYFQTSSLEPMYRKKSMIATPSSRIFSGSRVSSPELNVDLLHSQRDKRSSIKGGQTLNNEDGIVLHKEIKTSNGNYDVSVKVQADIEIPALEFNVSSDDDGDSPPKDSTSRVHEKSSKNYRETTLRNMFDNVKSSVSTQPTDETEVPNKSRSDEVEQNIPKTGARVASMPSKLIDKSKSMSGETIPGLQSPVALKLPALITQCKLREASERQRNKLNELKLKLAKLLPREPPRIPKPVPFPSVLTLPRYELLPGPRSSIEMPEKSPLAKLVSKCPPVSVPRNRVLDDLVTIPKVPLNDFELKRPEKGMTLLEKIKNHQLKLKQDFLRSKPEEYRIPSTGQLIECQFENEQKVLPSKLNPLIPIPDIITKARESTAECDDESNDVNSSPIDKFRSNSPKTEHLGDDLRVDTPPNAVSQEINGSPVITSAFIDDVFISKKLPNKPTDNVDLAKEVNKKEERTSVGRSTSAPLRHETDSTTPSVQLTEASSTAVNTPETGTAHTDHLSVDSNEKNQHPEKPEVFETVSESLPFVISSTEAEGVSTTVPISEPQRMQTEERYKGANDHMIQTISNHPHFVNHHEKNAPSYFSPAYMVPALGNNVYLSPEESYYRAMVEPASFHNDMQRIRPNYRPLLAENEFSTPERETVLNRPVVVVPNSAVPFDHPSRLMPNFNRVPDPRYYSLPREQGGMMMRAFVPAESYPNNNPVNPPSSNLFILQPVLTPNGNIPYPELLNKIRSGHAIIQILPTNPKDLDK